MQFGNTFKIQHIKNPIIFGRNHMNRNKKGAVVKKFEQLMVVIENRVYPLDIFSEFRKVIVLFEMMPTFTLADFFPTFHRLFGFNNENGVFRN